MDNPNTKSKPTTAAERLMSSPNHTANDMQLIPIEKVFSNKDSICKAREAFLIQKDIREETFYLFSFIMLIYFISPYVNLKFTLSISFAYYFYAT